MANYSKVIIAARLTRDPELTYTPSQMAICKVGLAFSRKLKTGEKTTFVDATIWDKRGEAFHKFLKKGDPVLVEGSLDMDEWVDKTTQQKRTKLYVTVNEFQFLSGKPKEDAGKTEAADDIPF